MMRMFSASQAVPSEIPGNETEGTFVRNVERSGSLASLCARPFVITKDEDGNEYVDTVSIASSADSALNASVSPASTSSPELGSAARQNELRGSPLHAPLDAVTSDPKPEPKYSERQELYFRDGIRRIDFILAYADGGREEAAMKRKKFLKNLESEGVNIETELPKGSTENLMTSNTAFVKVHASWEVLLCYAELLGFRMPVKKRERLGKLPMIHFGPGEKKNLPSPDPKPSLAVEPSPVFLGLQTAASTVLGTKLIENDSPWLEDTDDDISEGPTRFGRGFFDYDKKAVPREKKFYRAKISRDKLALFIVEDRETFFSPAQRSRIIWEVMIRTYFGSSPNMRGISGLLADGTFTAAYPLHDGSLDPRARAGQEEWSERRILHRTWAHPSAWYRNQPLNLIRKYFGEKTGFYFAWLGFYTSALLPPAVLGIFVCLHGLVELYTSVPIHDTCEDEFSKSVMMCPNCMSCKLPTLREELCSSIKINAFFDNTGAVIFSIFMSVWARIFIKLWNKREATLVFEWAVPEDEMGQEEINPDLEATAATYRLNPVTMDYEPYIPFWERVARTLSAASVVIFMIFLASVAVFGIIVYRSVMEHMLNRHSKALREDPNSPLQNPLLSSKAVASATASLVNLVCIWLLSFVYEKIARRLTHMERQRTISDFENSYTVKMFLFQSVNHYIGLFYIAFLKGRFQGHPGQTASILDADMETCDGGCLYEVFLQLFIIMVGKQIVNNIQEFLTPVFFRWWKYRRTAANKARVLTRWEMDYELKEWTMLSLFEEYLEMALQFGFCTLFVAAFPLAPLFALLNNIIEIRIDAYKYVVQQRRPRPQSARNIGVWHRIIEGISICAVVFNAFLIAFTTEFIPRAMFRLDHGSLDGYVNSTLSQFDVADYSQKPDIFLINATVNTCWYVDYRDPPSAGVDKYGYSKEYWRVSVGRLAFVVVFEHIIFLLAILVSSAIPYVSEDVKIRTKKEQILTQELFMKADLGRSKGNMINAHIVRPRSRIVFVS